MELGMNIAEKRGNKTYVPPDKKAQHDTIYEAAFHKKENNHICT